VLGVPTCGSRGLLTAVLRETWRWDGFVVSDYDAWANIALAHHYNATLRAGAAQGLNAGIDQEGGSALAISTLPAAIRDGLTTPAAVARAFRNLFRLRIRRGAARPPRLPRAHPSAPEVGPRSRLGMLDPPTHVSYNALRYNATELASNRRRLVGARGVTDVSSRALVCVQAPPRRGARGGPRAHDPAGEQGPRPPALDRPGRRLLADRPLRAFR